MEITPSSPAVYAYTSPIANADPLFDLRKARVVQATQIPAFFSNVARQSTLATRPPAYRFVGEALRRAISTCITAWFIHQA